MNPLAATQRERIRQHNEQENQEMDERTTRIKTEDIQLSIGKYPEKDKKVYFLPKCLLLLLAVLALLAAIVVLVYYFRDETSVDDLRGSVIDNKITKECHVTSVELGDIIVIECTFSNGITEEVVAIYKNVVDATTSDFECIKSKDEKNVTCTAKNETTCGSDGNVELRFLEGNDGTDKKVKFTKTVRVNIIVSSTALTTSMRQIYRGDNSNVFNMTCEYQGDCSSHVMKFMSGENDIADTRTCTTTFSNKDGYKVKCEAIISSQVILDHGNGSSINCTLLDGNVVIKEKEFALPSCDFKINEKNCSLDFAKQYDCDQTDLTLDNCTAMCIIANSCYSTRVLEVSTNSTSCPTKCLLGWCRHEATNEIDISGTISSDKLCLSHA